MAEWLKSLLFKEVFFLICFCCGLSVLHFICLVLCYKIVNLVLRLGVVDIVSISLFIALVSRIYALIVFYSKIDFPDTAAFNSSIRLIFCIVVIL